MGGWLVGVGGVAEDGDLVDGGLAGLFGGFEFGDEGEELGLAALAEVDEGYAEDAAGVGAVADGAEGAEGGDRAVDIDVDHGADLKLGEVGEAEKAAGGAEIEDAGG